MTAADALNRTLLLMRDHVRESVSDAELLEALASVEVALVADRPNVSVPEGQHALIAAAALCARSGACCYLEVPDLPLQGVHAPLRGERLGEGLADLGADLIPDIRFQVGVPAHEVDVALVMGDSPWRGRARHVVRVSGGPWVGCIGAAGERWNATGSPFGALAAAGLGAGESYKTAVRRFRASAADPGSFEDYFAPVASARVELAPAGTPPPALRLDRFDVVSGGAICHAALYALARVPGLAASVRVIEPKTSDSPDLNRYALLRRSRLGVRKVDDLASQPLGGLHITGIPLNYGDSTCEEIGPLAPFILVGVDDIPSRWRVQRARPAWLGVGATSHYSAMASFHSSGLACAICLHPRADDDPRPIPTVAFVSHWAGLWLASLLVRCKAGPAPPRNQQQAYLTMLRADSAGAVWQSGVAARIDCPMRCPL